MKSNGPITGSLISRKLPISTSTSTLMHSSNTPNRGEKYAEQFDIRKRQRSGH
jgi:hypothetical protein